jgi:hypothetical protein
MNSAAPVFLPRTGPVGRFANRNMKTILLSALFAAGLFLGMLVLLEVGRQRGRRRRAKDAEGASAGTGPVEGAIFALLGLLIAFTFSGAAARFDARRQLIVQEANAVGTAWLRLDLLPESDRRALQGLFRQYLDSRLEVYRRLPDLAAARAELDRSTKLQGEIWSHAVTACQPEAAGPVRMLLLPALNEMFDITTTRTMAAQTHPPTIIFALLFALGLGCALLAGYGMAASQERSWTHMIGFAAVMAVTVYVILDLEFPRLGLVRVDAADQVLVELRAQMN